MPFVHFRELLAQRGNHDVGELEVNELPGVTQAVKLVERFRAGQCNSRITAAQFSPLDGDSWVLMRNTDKDFELCRFRNVRATVQSRRYELTDYKLVAGESNTVRITNVKLPTDYRFLVSQCSNKVW